MNSRVWVMDYSAWHHADFFARGGHGGGHLSGPGLWIVLAIWGVGSAGRFAYGWYRESRERRKKREK